MGSDAKRLPARFFATPGGREPVREWLRSLDPAGRRAVGLDIMRRVRLAGRDAALPDARPWPLGGAEQLAGRQDRARDFLRAGRGHGPPAGLRQEDAEDPAAGDRDRVATAEGTGAVTDVEA